MRTPSFWQSDNVFSTLLSPLAALYGLAVTARRFFSPAPESLSVPIICIGNLTAGGGGKTPAAIAIGERLKQKNITAYFLSRGYGGALAGPVLVNPRIHTAHEVGDEPLLLANLLPTVVAKNRHSGALFAMQRGARVIIMDDGFQNPSLVKALSIVVVDGGYGFGNGRLLPAGPLREPLASGFARAQAVMVVNPLKELSLPHDLPVLSAHADPSPEANILSGKNVLAFCGLANPQKFFRTLDGLGAHIVERVIFPDHYLYRERDIRKLAERAKRKQAVLTTTAKDAVRLSPEWRSLVTTVPIALRLDNPEQLDALLDNALKQTW